MSLQTILEAARRQDKDHRIAADLVEIADQNTMTLRGVRKFPDLLKTKRLKPADITEQIVSIAMMLERRDHEETGERVKLLNSRVMANRTEQLLDRSPFPVGKKASPVVKTIWKILQDEDKPISLKGIFAIRRCLVEYGIDAEDIDEILLEKVQAYHNSL